MNEIEVSEEQADILDTWVNEDRNIVINAVAGSGKTTTLIELVKNSDDRTLLLAFNVSVKKELEDRLSRLGLRQGKVMTLHGLGLSAIRSRRNFRIVKGKNFEISKKLRSLNPGVFRRMPWKNQLRLSYTLMDMNDVSRLFLTDDISEIKSHFADMGKAFYDHPRLSTLWEKLIEIRESYYERSLLIIDFLDMLYIPVSKGLPINLDPVYLMVDEAQDLSYLQHKLIEKIMDKESLSKWIAVGDKNQSIYGFSGAYSNSFELFLERDNVVEKSLSTCYRCSERIINSANSVYPVMTPFKETPGTVEIINTIEGLNLIETPSMILCRNSAPLVDMYFYLVSKGKSCYIEGEEILSGVKNILRPYNRKTLVYAMAELNREYSELLADNSENGRIALHIFEESFNILKRASEALVNNSGTVRNLLEAIENLTTRNEEDSIMLCTIHKSKGLEANTVYILREDLIPSQFAKTPEQLKQERNLMYVARTRAKEKLVFINLEEF